MIQWTTEDPNIRGGVLNRNLSLVFSLNNTQTPPTYGVSKINAVYELKTYNKTVNHTDPKQNKTTSVNITVTGREVVVKTININKIYLRLHLHVHLRHESQSVQCPSEQVGFICISGE